jgi:hypothetical protein
VNRAAALTWIGENPETPHDCVNQAIVANSYVEDDLQSASGQPTVAFD